MRAAAEANPNMTEAEAVHLIERCIRVLYYRDARSYNKASTSAVGRGSSRGTVSNRHGHGRGRHHLRAAHNRLQLGDRPRGPVRRSPSSFLAHASQRLRVAPPCRASISVVCLAQRLDQRTERKNSIASTDAYESGLKAGLTKLNPVRKAEQGRSRPQRANR